MGRIILMRHGRTFANEKQMLDTLPPGAELSAFGRQQAADAAVQWQELSPKIGAVYCSVALRAQQTAMIATEAYTRLQGLPAHSLRVQLAQGIHEFYSGDHEGSAQPDALKIYGTTSAAWMNGNYDAKMPGGESANEVVARALGFFRDLAAEIAPAEHDAVVVSHGGTIRIMSKYLSDVPIKVAANHKVPNTDTVILHPEGELGTWHCAKWADWWSVRGTGTRGVGARTFAS